MRPLQLKLTGINSYREEQIIDFETLTSQGLFGIFGQYRKRKVQHFRRDDSCLICETPPRY